MQINVMAWLTPAWALVLVAARQRWGGRGLAALGGLSAALLAYNVWSLAPLRGLADAIARREPESLAPVELSDLPEELAGFSECFLCGTAAEITPVSEIGDDRFTPGDLSLSLMDEYSRLVRGQI